MLKNSPTKTDKQYHFSQSNETDSNSLERQGFTVKAMQYDSMSPMGKSACYPNSVPKNALNLHVQRRAKRLKKTDLETETIDHSARVGVNDKYNFVSLMIIFANQTGTCSNSTSPTSESVCID